MYAWLQNLSMVLSHVEPAIMHGGVTVQVHNECELYY